MSKIGPTLALFLVLRGIGISAAESDDMGLSNFSILKGSCSEDSHIAEGAIGDDLTKRQSRFFCDSAVLTSFSNVAGHVMIQFADSKSQHERPLGFAGMRTGTDMVNITNVYLEPGIATPATDGACKMFYSGKNISSIACGASIDENGRRTVPVVSFTANQPESKDPADNSAGTPYRRSGTVNCTLPGTSINFALDGLGAAQVTRLKTNYAPLKAATRQSQVWLASTLTQDGLEMLVLDNQNKTRVMVKLQSGKGLIFLATGGVSDTSCRVLVSP